MTSDPVCLDDFERHAAAVMPRMVLDYYRSGANAEVTLTETRRAFDRLVLRPRMLRDVSQQDLSTHILGRKVPFPFAIAPTAMHCMAHPDGEKATARAAAAVDALMVLSTLSTTRLEEVASAAPGDSYRWFQLYIYKDRELTARLVRRAEAAGFSALVLTVDAPVWGQRLADFRNKFSMPDHLNLMNFTEVQEASQFTAQQSSGLNEYVASLFDRTLSWKDVKWLISFSRLPVLVKGILTEEDARIAVDLGVAGIVVSNHGGRQLDSVAASIEALPAVARAAGGRCEVFLDGGVRRGTDVVKALLLGARAVFLGRPVLWSLSHSGEEGVKKMLRMMEEEVRVAMALLGARSVADLEPGMIAWRDNLPKL